MTDERRHEDRREEDVRLAEAVESFEGVLDARLAAEWESAQSIHENLAPKNHEHLEVTRLIDVLEGSPRKMPSGEIVREGGLIAEVSELNRSMRNGGVKIKVPPAVWVAIVVAIITGMFNVWAAFVSSPPW